MTLDLIAMALAALAMWRRSPGPRARGLLAALVMALAAASLRTFAGVDALASLRAGSFTFDGGGLVVLNTASGLILLALCLAVVARPGIPELVVVAASGWLTAPLWRLPGISRAMGVAAAIVAVSTFGWWLLLKVRPGRVLLAADRIFLDRSLRAAWRPGPGWRANPPILAAAVFALLALTVPHLWTVLGGVGLATVTAWIALHRAGQRHAILLVAAALVFLVLLWSVRLAGPLGGWIPVLIDGPFSPRTALLLAALTAGAALVLAGAWPLHGMTPPIVVAALVIPLAGTFGTLLIPDGMQFWQPLLAPLTLVGMMHAQAHRRTDALLLGGALLGFWTATLPGALGGTVLMLTAWILSLQAGSWLGRIPRPRGVVGILALIPAAGALLVLHGHLATEVAYGIVAAAVAAVAIATPPLAANAADLARSGVASAA